MASGGDSLLERLGPGLRRHWRTLAVWLGIGCFIFVALLTGLDKRIAALSILVFGLLTQAFSGLLGLVALIPWAGPLFVKVVTLPFFLLVNGLSYLVTLLVVRRGGQRDVVKSRILVSSFLVGILVGYILGRLVPVYGSRP